jgi:hypothetical protein
LGLGFGLQVVSIVGLVATALGMNNVPLPLIAALAEAVGMLVLARVFWDYEQEVRHLREASRKPDAGKLRRDFSTYLGLAVMEWGRCNKTDTAAVSNLASEIAASIIKAVGLGEADPFLNAIGSGKGDRALRRIIQRIPKLDIAPDWDILYWAARLPSRPAT